MESKPIKCFSTEHENANADYYCGKCNIYLCKTCETLHSKLFKKHETIILDKTELEDVFTGLCKEEGHNSKELDFFCRTHNQLCCAVCICKIKNKNVGQHKDCTVCLIEDIRNEKKNNLQENVKYLKELSINLEETIKELKNIFEKVNQDKEELKINVQKIFTKLRNALNNREDELLLQIDNKFNELFIEERIVRESEKLPKKVKLSINKSQELINDENSSKMNTFLNEYLNVENNIKEIKAIQENIKKFDKSKDLLIKLVHQERDINNIIEYIKRFGYITIAKKSVLKSNIINPKEEEIITNWIPNKVVLAELIFDTKNDGDSIDAFRNKCHGKSPTLCIIKTNKGIIFGGYASSEWGEDKYIKDNNSFVFSLNPNKKYKVISPDYALYGYSNEYQILFQFGGCCFRIVPNCTKVNNNLIDGKTYEKGFSDVFCEEKKFTVNRIEIFKLFFNE